MRVASKIGNLRSEFGHARPLASRIIRYVRDGQTDGRTKATLIAVAPSLRVRGHNNVANNLSFTVHANS